MKYLEIKFYDNDFGLAVENAARKVWKWIHESNAHCLQLEPNEHFSNKTLPQVFLALHKADALQPMILRTYQIEEMHGTVEFATRGLYWSKVNWEESRVKLPTGKEIDTYVNIDLKFRKNKNFMKKQGGWNNSESVILDLETGDITIW